MCTAYQIGDRDSYDVDFLVADSFEASLAEDEIYHIIRPTLAAPVVMPDGRVRTMSWGFRRKVPGKVKPVWRTIVNSREDKLKSPTWRAAFQERRCLIPAVAFYEWVEGAGKRAVPLRFTRPSDLRIWIAGIWENDPERGEVFSMITTEPSASIRPVHDRMPAVLAAHQIRAFIEGELDEFGPSEVELQWAEAENFLKPPDSPSLKPLPPIQGELF